MYRILNRNCEIILNKLLLSKSPISSSDIKGSLNISRKTVTEAIQKLDRYLSGHGASIRTINGIGYSIVKFDDGKFQSFSEAFLRHFNRDRFMYLDQNYLVYLIAIKFLVSESYISVEGLSEEYFHSNSTISQNLKKVKAYFKKFSLSIVSRPNYGLSLTGDEWNKRICMLFIAKIANAINFMQSDSIPVIKAFRKIVEKSLDNYFAIKSETEPVLQKYGIFMPLVYQMLISYYIELSQSRLKYYSLLKFKNGHKRSVSGTAYLMAAKEIAAVFCAIGYRIGENDAFAIAILLDCYATRSDPRNLSKKLFAECAKDTRRLVERIGILYRGAEQALDKKFCDEFICYLASIKRRLYFELPSDDGILFEAKHEGVFISDLCLDFARLYEELYGVQLKTPDLMSAYHIFASAYIRKPEIKAEYRGIIVSLYGTHLARNVAGRLLRIYDRVLIDITPMELSEANRADFDNYDLIITDIAKNQFVATKLPILFFDIYREESLRSLDKFISDEIARKLRYMVNEKNVIKNADFKNKEEIYEYLAERYVAGDQRDGFLEDCRRNNAYLSCERKNHIAVVSTYPTYYNKKDIVIIFNRSAILWDNELVQMILFFNRRGIKYLDARIVNIFQKRLLADVVGVASNLSRMSVEEFIATIAAQKVFS